MTIKQLLVGTLAGTTIIGLVFHRMGTQKPPATHPKHTLSAKHTPSAKLALHKTHKHKKMKGSTSSELSTSRVY